MSHDEKDTYEESMRIRGMIRETLSVILNDKCINHEVDDAGITVENMSYQAGINHVLRTAYDYHLGMEPFVLRLSMIEQYFKGAVDAIVFMADGYESQQLADEIAASQRS